MSHFVQIQIQGFPKAGVVVGEWGGGRGRSK